jgi:hypothetical protein
VWRGQTPQGHSIVIERDSVVFPHAALLGQNIAVAGLFGKPPSGGVSLIDTTNWSARVIDARSSWFVPGGDVLATYGPPLMPAPGKKLSTRGTGLSLYGADGKLRFHLYGARRVQGIQLVFGYGHAFFGAGSARPPLAVLGYTAWKDEVFDLNSGRAVEIRHFTSTSSQPFLIYNGSQSVGEVPSKSTSKRTSAAAQPARQPGHALQSRSSGSDEPGAFQRSAHPNDALPAVARRIFPDVTVSRRVASYVDGRGRRNALYVFKRRGSRICLGLFSGGFGGGCDPASKFFSPDRRVAAEEGRLFAGLAADEVTRVELVGIRGRVHRVRLTTDHGFIYNCRAYNGCTCVIASLRAYAADGRLVTNQRWLGAGSSCKKAKGGR